jgi:hypothetical protein
VPQSRFFKNKNTCRIPHLIRSVGQHEVLNVVEHICALI